MHAAQIGVSVEDGLGTLAGFLSVLNSSSDDEMLEPLTTIAPLKDMAYVAVIRQVGDAAIRGLIDADLPLTQQWRRRGSHTKNAIVMRVTPQGHVAAKERAGEG